MPKLPDACVRLFLSADLIGSTAFKNLSSGHNSPKSNGHAVSSVVASWAEPIFHFYSLMHDFLKEQLDDILKQMKAEEDEPLSSEVDAALRHLRESDWLETWKLSGDEALFVVDLKSPFEATYILLAFSRALNDLNREFRDNKDRKPRERALRVKGTAWIAGFPITNFRFESRDIGIEKPDFIGPSIDCGFRLTKESDQRRLVVSVDLAWLLTTIVLEESKPGAPVCSKALRGFINSPMPTALSKARCFPKNFSLHFDCESELKGVLNGRPYPVIWMDTGFHEGIEKLHSEKEPPNLTTLNKICSDYIRQEEAVKSWLTFPYWQESMFFGNVPESHLEIIRANPVEDLYEQGDSNLREKSSEGDVIDSTGIGQALAPEQEDD